MMPRTLCAHRKMKMKFPHKNDVSHDIGRIETIIDSGVFESKNSTHPLRESAFVELMICLRDLMSKTEMYGQRIDFNDDISHDKDTKDITDTITHVRDSICHIDSFKRILGKTKLRVSFNSINGEGTLMKVGDIVLRSDYQDDVCFFYGNHKIYLKRHIIRALKEAKRQLKPIMNGT